MKLFDKYLMLLLCLAAITAQAAVEKSLSESRPPNVILIISDDQGVGDLSSAGNEILRTPQLDRLYDKSVRLTDFMVSPLCAPSRASIMTGRYNYRGGVWDTWQGRADLAAEERTLGDMFSAAGYATAYFGK
jgi:arylsulfatase A-like enzyme